MNGILSKFVKFGGPVLILALVAADRFPKHGSGWQSYAGFGLFSLAVYLFVLFYAHMLVMDHESERVVQLNEAWRVRLIKEKDELAEKLRGHNPSD